jgi:hypothetical protein
MIMQDSVWLLASFLINFFTRQPFTPGHLIVIVIITAIVTIVTHHHEWNQENHGAPQWRSKSPCAARSCPGSWWLVLAAPRVGFCDVLRDSEEPLITRVGVAGPRWVAKTAWNCAREVSSVPRQEEVTAAFRNNKRKEKSITFVSLLRA